MSKKAFWRNSVIAMATALCLAAPLPVAAEMRDAGYSKSDNSSRFEAELREAWLLGKVETALLLNQHLNSFTIDSDVTGSTAILTGTVESGIDKELAGEVALSVKGIERVVNKLTVVTIEEASEEAVPQTTFKQRVNDVTITAAVKTRLVSNPHVDGLAVDVDTEKAVVTLTGNVKSAEERQLAELIARNTSDVKHVHNELKLLN